MRTGWQEGDVAEGKPGSLPGMALQRLRHTTIQLAVLARDELRALTRSRRGRLLGAVYLLLNLLPLLLYLWVRSRWVVTWPIDACDVAWYLRGHRLFDVVLIVVLGHDLLTRGDREGWQDGFASLPVGELSWFAGRLGGRLAALVLLMATPYLIGWGLASCWAGRGLDPLPFVSFLLGQQGLSLALLLPLVVLAGCAGSSLIAAVVVLVSGLVVIDTTLSVVQDGAGRLGLPSELAVRELSVTSLVLGGGYGAVRDTTFLGAVVLYGNRMAEENGSLSHWSGVWFRADAGRGWPPALWSGPQCNPAMVPGSWLLLLGLGPYLLRLRRRAGRLQLNIPSLPSFSRWLAELVDQTRPTRPEGRPARLLAVAAGVLLLASSAGLLVATAERGGRQRALLSVRVAKPAMRPWPVRLQPSARRIELRIRDDGSLEGYQLLQGTVVRQGHGRQAVPFALAPGITVLEVSDRDGRQLPWQRGPEQLWVVGLEPGEQELRISFRGRPRQVRSITSIDMHHELRGGGWLLTDPLQLSPALSGQRYWLVDLEGLSWAPEPLRYPVSRAPYRGREPCWGSTVLELQMPRRLVPLPLPGDWQEETRGDTTRVSWSGEAALLPPLVAGQLQRSELPDITVVSRSPGSDREGLARHWLAAWDEEPPMHDAGRPAPKQARRVDEMREDLDALALTGSAGVPEGTSSIPGSVQSARDCASRRQDPLVLGLVLRVFGEGALRSGFLHWSPEPPPDPDLERPSGLVTLPLNFERRPLDNTEPQGISAMVREARARLRFQQLAHRLDGSGPMVVRRLLWSLCNRLEQPQRRGGLALGPSDENELRTADLRRVDENDPSSFQRFQGKISTVSTAMASLLGPARLHEGLQRVAAGHGPLSIDGLWDELVGERAEELRWFRDEVIMSRRLAAPRLTWVEVMEEPPGWRVQATVHNDGDALTVVPLRLLGPQVARTVRVRVAAGEEATLSTRLDCQPEQVLLDPDGEVLRRFIKQGVSWTRWGGLQ